MEENRNEQTTESGEGVLTDVARAIGSTMGTAVGTLTAALGGADEAAATTATGPKRRPARTAEARSGSAVSGRPRLRIYGSNSFWQRRL